MVDTGFETPTDSIFIRGGSAYNTRNVGVAANMYPGRLVVREATDYDVKVADGILPVAGILGYEKSPITRPANISSIYTVDTTAAVHPLKSENAWYMPGGLAIGTKATQNDLLASWSNGQVVPCMLFGGRIGVKIPFTKNTGQTDTSVDIPSGAVIHDVIVQVTAADGSGTLDVGLGNGSEAGYDADGLLDGESLAATGFRQHKTVDGTASNNTLGALLVESDIKTADSSALYYSVPYVPGKICDGTCVSVDYTTSNHTVAGYIYVIVSSPGIQVVGRAAKAADATSAAANVFVEAV